METNENKKRLKKALNVLKEDNPDSKFIIVEIPVQFYEDREEDRLEVNSINLISNLPKTIRNKILKYLLFKDSENCVDLKERFKRVEFVFNDVLENQKESEKAEMFKSQAKEILTTIHEALNQDDYILLTKKANREIGMISTVGIGELIDTLLSVSLKTMKLSTDLEEKGRNIINNVDDFLNDRK